MKPVVPVSAQGRIVDIAAIVDVSQERNTIASHEFYELKPLVEGYLDKTSWEPTTLQSISKDRLAYYRNMDDKDFKAVSQLFVQNLPALIQDLALANQQALQMISNNVQQKNAQVEQFNQAAKSLSQTSFSSIQAPNVQIPTPSLNMNPLGNPSSTGYMINTDQGLQHGRCTTLPSGMVYCQ